MTSISAGNRVAELGSAAWCWEIQLKSYRRRTMKDVRCLLMRHHYVLQSPDWAAWPYKECTRCKKFKGNLREFRPGGAEAATQPPL